MAGISEAESRVMEVLWQRAPAPQSSDAVVDALRPSTGWHDKTIRTLLNRLLGKGAIRAEREGRRYLYKPVLTREAWQAQESRSLLDRVFGGQVMPLLAHFSRHEKLSEEEIAALRRLVEDIERKDKEP